MKNSISFDEKIRQIKIHRSAECYLEELFTDMRLFKHKILTGCIFFEKKSELLLQYNMDLKYLYFVEDLAHFLNKNYRINFLDCSVLIQKVAMKKLNIYIKLALFVNVTLPYELLEQLYSIPNINN